MKQFKFYMQYTTDEEPAVMKLVNPYDVSRWASFMALNGRGCYEVTVKKAVKSKSRNQLGAIFGLLLSSAIEQANDMGLDTSSFLKEMVKEELPSGIGLTKDLLKDLFYCLCPIFRDGKRITLRHASAKEAAKYFEDCRNLLAAHGIYVDEPNPDYKETKNGKCKQSNVIGKSN